MASGLVGGYQPRDPRRGRVSVAKLTALTWALSAAIGLKRYSKSTSGPPVRVDGGRFTAHGQAQARSKGHDVAVNASVSAAEQHSCRGELACRVWGAESWRASWLVARKDAGQGWQEQAACPLTYMSQLAGRSLCGRRAASMPLRHVLRLARSRDSQSRTGAGRGRLVELPAQSTMGLALLYSVF